MVITRRHAGCITAAFTAAAAVTISWLLEQPPLRGCSTCPFLIGEGGQTTPRSLTSTIAALVTAYAD